MLLLQIWFQVKAANPHLSVCQIGATIGRMWRELSEAEKQRHLEEFQQDKVSLYHFIIIIIRPHCLYYVRRCGMSPTEYRGPSVGCRSVTLVSPAKVAEPIKMSFRLRTGVGPGNRVFDWCPPRSPREGTILRGRGGLAHCKVQGHSAVTCAKMAELIMMLFGLWARTGPRNHELDGGPDPP